MKKLLLLAIGLGVGMGAFAQKGVARAEQHKVLNSSDLSHGIAARTSAIGDTFELSHITSMDTLTYYTADTTGDSGFVGGTDAYGDKGFAERYDFTAADSTMKVIGVAAIFGGHINPASTKTITFNCWAADTQTVFDPSIAHVYNSGLPGTVLASATASITHLGIGVADTAADTGCTYLFTAPTAFLRKSFFVGYTISYTFAGLAGDTITVYSSKDNERTSAIYTTSGADTIINNANATQYIDGTWHDNAVDNFFFTYNYALFPIVKIGNGTLAVQGITKNNFTFFGNYPNPAVDGTNIKFSLAKGTDVTITINDMAGRTIKTVTNPGLSIGEHIIPVSTRDMAPGNYIYIVHTAAGDGMASTMTVAK